MARIIPQHTIRACIACPWMRTEYEHIDTGVGTMETSNEFCGHPHFPDDIDNLLTVDITMAIQYDCPLKEVDDATVRPAG